MLHEILATAIFALTIGTIVFFAGRVSEWMAALAGAALMLLCGILTPASAASTVWAEWDVLLFFLGLVTIVAASEQASIFSWLAEFAARAARGSERRLYFAILCVAALVTVFLTNDAAVLFMIPLIAELVRCLGLRVLPFALGVAFISNSASALLPISNPTNFIVAQTAGLSLWSYLGMVGLPAAAAAITAAAYLWFFFAARMRERFDPSKVEQTGAPARSFGVALIFVAGAMVAASALRVPVGIVATAGGFLLVGILALQGRGKALAAIRATNFSIVVFVASLFVVVAGLRNSGILQTPTTLLVRLLETHASAAAPLSALFMALGSNVVNNLPLSMVAVQMLQHDGFSQDIGARFAAGTIVGLAIGPNLTPIGSLSTILLRILLRRRGLEVPLQAYVIPGIIVTALTLLAAALTFPARLLR